MMLPSLFVYTNQHNEQFIYSWNWSHNFITMVVDFSFILPSLSVIIRDKQNIKSDFQFQFCSTVVFVVLSIDKENNTGNWQSSIVCERSAGRMNNNNNNKILSQPHDCAVFTLLYELAVLTSGRRQARVGGYQKTVRIRHGTKLFSIQIRRKYWKMILKKCFMHIRYSIQIWDRLFYNIK